MKAITTKLAILMAASLISVVPVLAESEMGPDQGQSIQKDECLLASTNCRESVDSIQMRIERLNREIAKGNAVYSGSELGRLESQLREATERLVELTGGGA